MNLRKFGTTLFMGLMITVPNHGRDYAPKVIEVIEPPKPPVVTPYEEDDFVRIRRQRYENGGNIREFLYFSRWHDYLDELADEKLRQEEYEYSLQRYESELDRVNKENQKIRERSQSSTTYTNVPQGNSVNIDNTNYNTQGTDNY